MRVAGDVGILMMFAMHANPGDGRTLAGQSAEQRQNAPHDRIRLETEVRHQPMVAQAHAQPAGQPRQNKEQQQALPGEYEWRRQGADVDQYDPKDGVPVQGRATIAR